MLCKRRGSSYFAEGLSLSIIGQIWMKLSPGVPHLRVPRHLVVKGTEPFPRRVYGVLQCQAARPYSSECVETAF